MRSIIPCSTVAVQREAAKAVVLAQLAEEAYELGSQVWAGLLHGAAERSHTLILGAICGLTDAAADLIEPEVTNLENRLRRLILRMSDRRCTAEFVTGDEGGSFVER